MHANKNTPMSDLNKEVLESSIAEIHDPHTGDTLGQVAKINVTTESNGDVNVEIVLNYPAASYAKLLSGKAEKALSQIEGVGKVNVTVGWNITSHSVQKGLKVIDNIKNIIAVASGKGGVGKSTTAVNLALALTVEGASVGILDADIYGPSQPSMLGIDGQPESKDGKTLEPIVSHNIQAMSIGFLIDKETPMVWRGPMVTQALEQLLTETNWRDLDYLVIDLPPGTGDVQLTLAQKIPVSGAIIVTTPQNIALLDARKGIKMFEKVDVPILGVIENMSTHICGHCGHEEHIFGAGGGGVLADEFGVDVLGCLPLVPSIREQTDSGAPTVVSDPQSRVTEIYRDIARKAAAKLAVQKKDFSAKFPKIVVQNA